MAGLGKWGCWCAWASTRSVPAIRGPNSWMGLSALTSLFASKHSSTSVLCCHQYWTWRSKSVTNCWCGCGLSLPLEGRIWYCWLYAVFAWVLVVVVQLCIWIIWCTWCCWCLGILCRTICQDQNHPGWFGLLMQSIFQVRQWVCLLIDNVNWWFHCWQILEFYWLDR